MGVFYSRYNGATKMGTGRGIALLLVVAVLPAGADEGLSGKITSGKAKKLVERAGPLVEKGDDIFKRVFAFRTVPEDGLDEALSRARDHYTEACALLDEALTIRNDPSVIGLMNHAARKLTQVEGTLSMRKLRRIWKEREERKRAEPQEQPEPPRSEPPPPPSEPRPQKKLEPQDPFAPPAQDAPSDSPEGVEVEFAAGRPPALPVATDLPLLPEWSRDESWERQRKVGLTGIKARLQDYFDARRQKNLVHRCRLCRAKGTTADGDRCPDCLGAGRRINQYHFRRAFWNPYSPMLRDAPGALDRLVEFYGRAQRDPKLLGPLVKTFKVTEIHYHDYWARAQVNSNTNEGKKQQWFTLVQIGSRWYFFSPATDRMLVRKLGG